MFSDRAFRITLIISLVVHGAIIFGNPNFGFLPAKNKENPKLEIRYIETPETKALVKAAPLPKKEGLLKIPAKIGVQKTIPQPFSSKENTFVKNNLSFFKQPSFNKPAFVKPDIIAIKKIISFPPIDLEKINNPTYISYYQIVRERIKRCAYQIYTGKETGEVTVSFVISNDGFLVNMRLIEEKSAASAYLKKIAAKSIKDASPFPNFPKELDYPQLSFNLTFTFAIE
jgi:TonB family protein